MRCDISKASFVSTVCGGFVLTLGLVCVGKSIVIPPDTSADVPGTANALASEVSVVDGSIVDGSLEFAGAFEKAFETRHVRCCPIGAGLVGRKRFRIDLCIQRVDQSLSRGFRRSALRGLSQQSRFHSRLEVVQTPLVTEMRLEALAGRNWNR